MERKSINSVSERGECLQIAVGELLMKKRRMLGRYANRRRTLRACEGRAPAAGGLAAGKGSMDLKQFL